MWHAEFRLYLYPTDSEVVVDRLEMIAVLRGLAFIGEDLEGEQEGRYKVGEAFLSLICFMGCSPNIEIEPQENSPFCYVEIPKKNQRQFMAGENVKKVKCPCCKAIQTQLASSLLAVNEEALLTQKCAECGEGLNPAKLNWRKSAFIAKTWVLLGNIYEAEAVPNEKLLAALQQLSGCAWQYAYIRKRD